MRVCVRWGGSCKVCDSVVTVCTSLPPDRHVHVGNALSSCGWSLCTRVHVCACAQSRARMRIRETGEGVHPLAEREGGQRQRLKWTSGQSRTVWHALCHRGQGYPAVGLLRTSRAPESGPPGAPEGVRGHGKRGVQIPEPFGGVAWVGSAFWGRPPCRKKQTFSGGDSMGGPVGA